MEIVHKMIKVLGSLKYINENSSIDVVKLQKRNNKELLIEEQYNAPHPEHKNSYGTTNV